MVQGEERHTESDENQERLHREREVVRKRGGPDALARMRQWEAVEDGLEHHIEV